MRFACDKDARFLFVTKMHRRMTHTSCTPAAAVMHTSDVQKLVLSAGLFAHTAEEMLVHDRIAGRSGMMSAQCLDRWAVTSGKGLG